MVRSVPAKTQSVMLICGKCSKKIGGGFGKKGDKSLAKELGKLAGGKKGRKSDLLVLETKCLKLCPKGAVVAVKAANPEKWAIIPAHTDIAVIAVEMGIQPPTRS